MNYQKNDIQLFLNSKGIRIPSGYKYKAINKEIYNIELAHSKAKDLAKTFFEKRLSILNQAAENLDKSDVESGKKLISLCVWDADFFGRFFCEGTVFLENLFRVSANNKELIFMTPSEYLEDQKNQEMQTVETEFSSSNFNGYAETTIDANNDWVYRHILRSIDRMSELADRFPNETGVRERCLNQAAREIMLALSSDWPRLMSEIHSSSLPRWKSYARKRIEDHIRNFTTIYESLGSNHLNTKFLTDLEQSNTIFPQINYKVFKKNR
ncbi:MAG: hypothetical protein Ta2F_17080 [Termitinemataceae bacterium]|nr:MAG: hypothetical protein Ta2F_17080 [Termitinemataceae bacterium]